MLQITEKFDAKFYGLKLLFETFWRKTIKGPGNYECIILRVKVQCSANAVGPCTEDKFNSTCKHYKYNSINFFLRETQFDNWQKIFSQSCMETHPNKQLYYDSHKKHSWLNELNFEKQGFFFCVSNRPNNYFAIGIKIIQSLPILMCFDEFVGFKNVNTPALIKYSSYPLFHFTLF